MRISIPGGQAFSAAPDQSLLDAALQAGMNLPHSCKSGNCGSCLARLVRGEVAYPSRPLGISDAEIADGLVLLCQARARSDIELKIRSVVLAGEATIKRLPCRIERTETLSHDVLGVYLRLPAAEDFHFQAGQYIDIMLSGGRRRSFSIASPPQGSKLLELQVRRVMGGEFTEALFAESAARKLLSIEGPLGQFVYRESAAPMLMIGGGTGLAPLNSIMRYVIQQALPRRMTLYWGVRSEHDLYAHALLLDLVARAPHLTYVPVLSAGSPQWPGARGLVHEAVLRDMQSLANFDIYASGPPEMIDAIRKGLPANGALPERIFFDSFDYAPDTQDNIARTKS